MIVGCEWCVRCECDVSEGVKSDSGSVRMGVSESGV